MKDKSSDLFRGYVRRIEAGEVTLEQCIEEARQLGHFDARERLERSLARSAAGRKAGLSRARRREQGELDGRRDRMHGKSVHYMDDYGDAYNAAYDKARYGDDGATAKVKITAYTRLASRFIVRAEFERQLSRMTRRSFDVEYRYSPYLTTVHGRGPRVGKPHPPSPGPSPARSMVRSSVGSRCSSSSRCRCRRSARCGRRLLSV